jgi:hypothetical protein
VADVVEQVGLQAWHVTFNCSTAKKGYSGTATLCRWGTKKFLFIEQSCWTCHRVIIFVMETSTLSLDNSYVWRGSSACPPAESLSPPPPLAA